MYYVHSYIFYCIKYLRTLYMKLFTLEIFFILNMCDVASNYTFRLQEEIKLLVVQNDAYLQQVNEERAKYLGLQGKWHEQMDTSSHQEMERFRETHK